MFNFFKMKDTAVLAAQCAALLRMVRPEVEDLMACTAGPAGTGMAEYYATLYFLWLAREKADWHALFPHLPDAVLDTLTVMRLDPKDHKKHISHIRSYWRTLEHEELVLLRSECSPLGWLENRHSGFAGIAAGDRAFSGKVLEITCALIRRLELEDYEAYCPPPKPAPKVPLSDIRPQPPRKAEFITVSDHQGNSVKMQVLDIITTIDGTFACLHPEHGADVVVLKTVTHPDGRAAYGPAGEKEARLVSAIFRTRNPQLFGEN